MWDSFLIAVLCGISLLYIPGFLVNKALRFDTLLSIVMAPVVSCLVSVFVGIALYLLPMQISGLTFLVSSIGISFLVFLVSMFSSSGSDNAVVLSSTGILSRVPKSMTRFSMMGLQSKGANWTLFLLFIAFALLSTIYMFLGNVGSANSILRNFVADPSFIAIQGLVQTGTFSIATFAIDANTGDFIFASFSLWQFIPALISSLTGSSPTVCFNAFMAILLIAIFPLGIFGLLSIVFHRTRLLIATGAVLTMSFAACPWIMSLSPALTSCLIAVAFVPYALISILGITIQGSRKQSKLVYLLLLVSTLVSFLCTLPNLIFAFSIMCVPYLVSRYFCWVNDFGKFARPVFAKIVGVIACLSAVFLIWVVFCNIPFVPASNSATDPVYPDLLTSLASVCFLSLIPNFGAQIVLGLMVLCGAVILLFKKGYRWVVATWAVCCVLYLIRSIFPESVLRYTLGFWYVDLYALSALVCISSVPLAAVFSETVIRALSDAVRSVVNCRQSKTLLAFVGCAFLAIFVFQNTFVASASFIDGRNCSNPIAIVHEQIKSTSIYIEDNVMIESIQESVGSI